MGELGVVQVPPAIKGPRTGETRCVFPRTKACRYTLKSDTAPYARRAGKNYYYGKDHILMRCDSCKIRRHIDYKKPV